MPRARGGTATRTHRKRIMELTKSCRGLKHLQFKAASTQVFVSRKYAFRGRRKRRSESRKLWIARINAAARQDGLSYSELIHGLEVAGIGMNRKMPADITCNDEKALANLADAAKKILN